MTQAEVDALTLEEQLASFSDYAYDCHPLATYSRFEAVQLKAISLGFALSVAQNMNLTYNVSKKLMFGRWPREYWLTWILLGQSSM